MAIGLWECQSGLSLQPKCNHRNYLGELFLLAWSICGICPVDVKVKMLKPRELCGRNPMQHVKYPEKTGKDHDRSRVRVVFTN